MAGESFKRHRLWLLLTVALSLAARAADSQPLRFDRITADDGLLQSQIHALTQDHLGFLWVGTRDGIFRYDGTRFVTWRKSATVALPSNDIRTLFEDAAGNLWIGGASGGLSRFDPMTETFELFAPDPDDPHAPAHEWVAALWQDTAGTLWVGTDGGGLDRFDPASGNFTHFEDSLSALAEGFDASRIRDLAGDANGSLWVATSQGLIRLTIPELEAPPAVTAEVFRHDPDDPGTLGSNGLHALAFDPWGDLWVATDAGLDRLDPRLGTFEHFRHDPSDPDSLVNDRVRSLLWAHDRLWVGTLAGLDDLDPSSGAFRHHRHRQVDTTTLSDDGILSLHQDASGLIWIGTRIGLNKLNPLGTQFAWIVPDPARPDDGIRGHRIRSVLEGRDGTLWIGTRRGLDALDRDSGQVRHFGHDPDDPTSLGHDDVTALFEDHRGTLWVGTQYAGASRLDRGSGRFRHLRHDPDDPTSLASDDVLAIVEDSAQRLWIGTYDGLSLFDRETKTFRNYRHDPDDPGTLSSSQIYTVYPTPDGSLWVGTGTNEANQFDPQTGRVKRHALVSDPSLGNSGSILAYLATEPGKIWVAVWDHGLFHLDIRDGTTRVFSRDDGLASNNIFGLLVDDFGDLWISTTHGLSRLGPDTGSVTTYTKADGLPSSEFSIHAAHRGRDELFFGGINGLVVVDPSRARSQLDHVPNTVLTAIEIRNQAAALDIAPSFLRQLDLAHDEDWLSIRFAALDFVAPERNRYRYSFGRRGAPEAWKELDNRREITFSDLGAGEYVLKAQGSNSRGQWDNEGAQLAIRVAAPFWQSWWFRLLVLSSMAAAVFLFFELRTYAVRQHAERLEAEIRERRRTEAEREQLIGELEAKNTELERFNYTMSHDLKSPLVTIRGFLGYLEKDATTGNLDRMRKDIDRIANAVDTMQTLIDELLSYSRAGIQALVFEPISLTELVQECVSLVTDRPGETRIEIRIAPELPEVWGDRLRLFQVFLNLLGNATKFMGSQNRPSIEVGVRESGPDHVVVFVRDNGIGIAPHHQQEIFGLFNRLEAHTEGTGIGLALVKRIVELHGGGIWVESEGKGTGSTFCVRLPRSTKDQDSR